MLRPVDHISRGKTLIVMHHKPFIWSIVLVMTGKEIKNAFMHHRRGISNVYCLHDRHLGLTDPRHTQTCNRYYNLSHLFSYFQNLLMNEVNPLSVSNYRTISASTATEPAPR
jgi:hypothetical protein